MFLTILFGLIPSVRSEILSVTTQGTWQCSSSSTECSMIVDSACDSGCSGSEYHCPSDPYSCDVCELICDGGSNACENGIFYSYYCKQVNIITNSSSESALSQMKIYGPNNGTLNVTIADSAKDSFSSSKIYSNNTKNIFFDLHKNTGVNIAKDAIIYGRDVQDSIVINLRGNAQKFELYCPIQSGTQCIVNCTGNIGNNMCRQMVIYTKNGFNNNFQLSSANVRTQAVCIPPR